MILLKVNGQTEPHQGRLKFKGGINKCIHLNILLFLTYTRNRQGRQKVRIKICN